MLKNSDFVAFIWLNKGFSQSVTKVMNKSTENQAKFVKNSW